MSRLLGLAASFSLFLAAGDSRPDERASRGFDHFYNLEYDQAMREFRQLASVRPEDPNVHNHIAQTILYREMHEAGALESELVSGSNPFLRREKVNPSPEAAAEFDKEIAQTMTLSEARI